MTQTAGKAAPAVAVVGALAGASPALGLAAAQPAAAAQGHPDLPDAAAQQAHHVRTYAVQRGDTLSGIARRYYGHASDWHWLYRINRQTISNPRLVYPGEVLRIPRDPPAWAGRPYRPRHARLARASAHAGSAGALRGTLGCSGLEHLWRSAGGARWAATTAAAIAMAESSGRQFATGAAGERGYWQINPVNGALSSYRPPANARAAVILSHNGSNWSPWTTYTSGAYRGRC